MPLWNRRMFPGTNLQDLNLDWIISKFAALRGGTSGQYLYKKSDADFDFGWKTGSGGGGTSDYLDLENKPAINNVELIGNMTASELGLAASSDIPTVPVQSVNGKTGAVVLDATDVGAGTYSKPATGIPKTDLADSVQESLNKADTALQAVPSTYRTASAQDVIDAAQDSNLATIESSPATAAHAVGEYIVLNGQLYKVTAAIASGQSLTPGTNIAAVSGGGLNDLTKTASETPTALQSFNTNYSLVKKLGRCAVCTLDLQNGDFTANSGGWYNIAQVTSNFFPDSSVGYTGYGYLMKSDYSIISQTFQVQANGNIRASILSGTYIRAFAQIVYFTN